MDAGAAGALFTAMAAVVAWTLLVLDQAPREGVGGILAALLVMLFLLAPTSACAEAAPSAV